MINIDNIVKEAIEREKVPFCDMDKDDPKYKQKNIIGKWNIQYTSAQQRIKLKPQFTQAEKNAKVKYQNQKLATLTTLAKKALDMMLPMVQNARIKADYQGKGTWYSGKIVRQNGNNTFDIDYDNGKKEKKVPSDRIFANGTYISPRKEASWLYTLRQIANTDLKYISNIQNEEISCYNRIHHNTKCILVSGASVSRP